MPSRITFDVNISNGVWDHSLSESKLFIHRFFHRLDDLNHFFIIKFLNLVLPSSYKDHLLEDGLDEEEEEEEEGVAEGDVEAGRGGMASDSNSLDSTANSNAAGSLATKPVKLLRILKKALWFGLVSSTAAVSVLGFMVVKKVFFSPRTASSGDNSAVSVVSPSFWSYNPFAFLFQSSSSSGSDAEEGGGVSTTGKLSLGALGGAIALSRKKRSKK
jgi:hypothetical protein